MRVTFNTMNGIARGIMADMREKEFEKEKKTKKKQNNILTNNSKSCKAKKMQTQDNWNRILNDFLT